MKEHWVPLNQDMYYNAVICLIFSNTHDSRSPYLGHWVPIFHDSCDILTPGVTGDVFAIQSAQI